MQQAADRGGKANRRAATASDVRIRQGIRHSLAALDHFIVDDHQRNANDARLRACGLIWVVLAGRQRQGDVTCGGIHPKHRAARCSANRVVQAEPRRATGISANDDGGRRLQQSIHCKA